MLDVGRPEQARDRGGVPSKLPSGALKKPGLGSPLEFGGLEAGSVLHRGAVEKGEQNSALGRGGMMADGG